MHIEGLFIGDECCDGRIINGNQQWIAKTLYDHGFLLKRSITIGDDIDPLVKQFQDSIQRSEVVIVTGGLGPTEDDRTTQALALACGIKIERNLDVLASIQSYFRQTKRDMPEENKKQADFPIGAKPLLNPLGTAPGVYLHINGTHIFCCPGVPKEMHHILNQDILPFLKTTFNQYALKRQVNLFKCIGIGESHCAEKLQSLYPLPQEITLTFQAKPTEIQIRVSTTTPSEKYKQIVDYCQQQLADYCYSNREHESLAERIITLAKTNKKTVALAESCTGGGITQALTAVSGASQVVDCSVVTYSNEAKQQWLDVTKKLLDNHGAVSSEVVTVMAKQIKKQTTTTIGLAVSGIAGPTGGSKEKPVGLVYFGVSTDPSCRVIEKHFRGDRADIQRRATMYGLMLLWQEVKQL